MFSYEEYKQLMIKQIKMNDMREIVIQENVIKKFLTEILTNIDIVSVDKKLNSSIHDYTQYCGIIMDNGKEKPWTPDLCISNNWNWRNKEYEINYKFVVEVKSPFLDPITGFESTKYSCLNEIQTHLNAKNNKKVILTDGVTWTFYNNDINPLKSFYLGDLQYKYKTNSNRKKAALERDANNKPIIEDIIWKQGEKKIVNDEVILEIFGEPLTYVEDIIEFNELKDYIREFVTLD